LPAWNLLSINDDLVENINCPWTTKHMGIMEAAERPVALSEDVIR
jgi:hypothetical protein